MKSALRNGILPLVLACSATAVAAPGGVVTDLGVWLKSDDAGSDISVSWEDRSPNANPVEAINDGGVWTLSAADAGHNYHPYTTGYSSERFFQSVDSGIVPQAATEQPLTVFAVTRQSAYASGSGAARITALDDDDYNSFFNTNAAGEPALSIMAVGNAQAGKLQARTEMPSVYGGTPAFTYSTSAVPLNQNVISQARIGGVANDQLLLGFNGNGSLTTLAEPSYTRGDVISVGFGTQSSGNAFNGDIMEVIWYTRELSDDEVLRVNSYLALKYGVGLNSNYVGSDGTVWWDTTEDSGFNAAVAGIARDDDSGLHQKISRSVVNPALTVALQNDFSTANNARGTQIIADDSWFLTGTNGADIALQTNEVAAPFGQRTGTEWRVQSDSFTQAVTLRFELPAVAGASEYHLIRKAGDSDFSAGAEDLGVINRTSGIITGLVLNDGDYFTVAVVPDSDGDGVLDQDDAFPDDPTETVDSDGDGIGDNADPDDDNDGYTDADELTAGTDPYDPADIPADNDNDGISDINDTDDDNDGLSDADEALLGTDPQDPDTDNDGVADGIEVGADVSSPDDLNNNGIADVFDRNNDSDRDGLSNAVEYSLGSDPMSRDSDGDDFRDDEELALALTGEDLDSDGIDDGIDADTTGLPDRNGDGIADAAVRDTDGDGVADLLDTDSDDDGLTDLVENLLDSDQDGIANVRDGVTVAGGGDNDLDYIPDAYECCGDADADGQPDYTEYDSDADFLTDVDEAGLSGTDTDLDGYDDIYDADVDGDGIVDNGPDTNGNGRRDNWVPLDTDGDGLADFRDTDSDNDGISDAVESTFGTYSIADEDGDGIPDRVDPVSGENGGDSDGDGLSDKEECPQGYPFCTDTDFDGTPDYMEAGEASEIPATPCEMTVEGCPVEEAPVEEAPTLVEDISSDIGVSTALGSFNLLWLALGALLVRRRTLTLVIGSLVTLNASALELSEERLYALGRFEYTQFSPEAPDAGVTFSDQQNLGYGLGVGYDLLDSLGLELDYSDKGEVTAQQTGDDVSLIYGTSTFTAKWYPDLWYANRRYDDDWPRKFNWYISGGISRIFISGTAVTETENNVNFMIGAGATYGLTPNWQLRASVDRVAGDVLTYGLSVMWYPWAKERPGQRRFAGEEERRTIPIYRPSQTAIPEMQRRESAQCSTGMRMDVGFKTKSYSLKENEASGLSKVVDDFFRCQGVTVVLVGGDSGDDETAQLLDKRRADSIETYLNQRGVPSNRIVRISCGVNGSCESRDKDKIGVYFGR